MKTISPSEEIMTETPDGIPPGFLTLQRAAKLLGLSITEFKARMELGKVPDPEEVLCSFRDGTRRRNLWRETSLQALMPKPKFKGFKLDSEVRGLFDYLWSRQKKRVIDGEQTDIMFGNPPTPRTKTCLDILCKHGFIKRTRDNWGRAVYTMTGGKYDVRNFDPRNTEAK